MPSPPPGMFSGPPEGMFDATLPEQPSAGAGPPPGMFSYAAPKESPPDDMFPAADDTQRKATPLEKVLDTLSTPTYASAGAARALLSGRNPFEGAQEGIANKTTYGDLLREHGVDPVTSGIMGFGLDVLLDPLTYTGIGAVTKAGSAARAATIGSKLASLSSDATRMTKAAARLAETGEFAAKWGGQANKEQRALITFLGHPVVKGGRVLDVIEGGKDAALKTRPGKALRKKFDLAPDLDGIERSVFLARKAEVEAASRLARASTIKALRPYGQALRNIAKVHNIPEADMRKIMADVLEGSGGAKLGSELEAAAAIKPGKKVFETFDPKTGGYTSRTESFAGTVAPGTMLVDAQKLAKSLESATALYGKEAREALHPVVSDMVTRVNTINARILSETQGAGIIVDDLLDDMGYLARRHTRESTRWLAEHGQGGIKNAGEEITEKHRAIYQRELRGVTTTEANRMYREGELSISRGRASKSNPLDHDLFFDDPLIATTIRSQEGAKAVSSAKFIKDYVREHGLTKQDLLDAPSGVSDIAGKTTKHFGRNFKNIEASGFEKVETKIRGFEEVWLPNDIAKAMKGHLKAIEHPGPFLENFDRAQLIWKKYTLGIFPVYHTRNELGDLWNATVLGGMNMKHLPNAARIAFSRQTGKGVSNKILKLGRETMTEDEVWELAARHGVTDTGIVGELAGSLQTLKDKPNIAGQIVDAMDDNVATRMGMAVGTVRENSTRLASFMDRLAKGDAPEVAAMHVKKFLIDYGALTDFERNVMRRVMPFYSWTRFNTPLQLEGLLKRPGAALAVQKLRDEAAGEGPLGVEGGTLPRFLEEGLPLRFGSSSEGNPQFLRLEGMLPMADVNTAMDPGAALTRAVSLLSPFISTPVEMATNIDLFRSDLPAGRVSNIERFPGETGSVLGMPMNRRFAKTILESARPVTELNRLNPGNVFGTEDKGSVLFPGTPRDRPDPSGAARAIGLGFGRAYAVDPETQKKRQDVLVKRKIGELKSQLRKARKRNDKGNVERIERRIKKLRDDPASLFR